MAGPVPSPADMIPRVLARGIDVALLVAADVSLGLVIGFGYHWLAIGSASVITYFALLDAMWGATIGKLALGLRVVGPDGAHPSIGAAFKRESFTLLGSIPFVGPLLALAAWAWIVSAIRSSPARQGPHDRFAGGTRVVRI